MLLYNRDMLRALYSPLRYLCFIAFGVGFFVLLGFWQDFDEAQAHSPHSVNVDLRINTLFDLVNEYRVSKGLNPVAPSLGLTQVADWMARDMAANNYMAHQDSLGRDPFQRMDDLGYSFNTTKGENVAAGPDDAETTMDLWKNSPGHNENLLRREFTVMGLARSYNANSELGWYWAQELGGFQDHEALYNPLNSPPSGVVDGVTCAHAWGWARDADSSPPIYMKVYRDGAAGSSGVLLEEFTANNKRTDLGMNVGFDWAVPNQLKDGTNHELYFYGIDTDGAPDTALSGSPVIINCSASGKAATPPDISVQSVTLFPSNPQVSTKLRFEGLVTNDGQGDAGSTFVSLRIDVGNNGTWDVSRGQITIDSLPGSLSGTKYLFTASWIDAWTGVVGTHRFAICADAGGSVAESDETNNCRSYTFSIPGASTTPASVSIPEGAMIRAKGGIDIWIVKYVPSSSSGQAAAKKFKRLILSPTVFNSYGHLRWEDVIEVDQATLDSFIVSDLVRAEGDPKVYRLFPQGDTGIKRWITTAEVFSTQGFDWDAIYTINTVDRDSYTEGTPY